jgi:repressor LexA
MALTKRQKEIYDFIKGFIEEKGYSPSLEEIGQAFQLSSVATVHKHVTNLVRKGLLRRTWNQNRSIDIVREDVAPRAVEVPLLGRLASGQPVEPLAGSERVAIPSWLVGQGRTYLLEARDDSMQEHHVQRGDYLVIEERRSASSGQLVLGLRDGDAVVLERRTTNTGPTPAERPPEEQGALPGAVPMPPEARDLRGIVLGIIRKC